MPTNLEVLPVVLELIAPYFRAGVAAPLRVAEPAELDFLEIMTSFHTASSNCVPVLRHNPHAVFQNMFLRHVPTNIVDLMIDFMDDSSAFRFTRTCKTYLSKSEPRMTRSAFFKMRYHNHVAQGLSVINSNSMYIEILNSMVTSRARSVASISEFLAECGNAVHCRSMSFDNEWPRMWPRHISSHALLQDGSSSEVFDPLYDTICDAIDQLAIVHLRLVSLAMHPRITIRVASSPTITRLTVERSTGTCQIPDMAYHAMQKMRNVLHLRIGFTPDTFEHDRIWTTFALCPRVQHLFAYADTITRVGLEYPFYCPELSHIHDLVTLHVQGSCPRMDNLAYWIATAGAGRRAPGSLLRIKIHAYATILHEEAYWLVAALGRFHPCLRVLVLDGLDHVTPKLFALIRVSFPQLLALCVVRRISPSMHSNRLVTWDYPAHYYSDSLNGHATLEHVELNVSCKEATLEPIVIDDADDGVPSLYAESSDSTDSGESAAGEFEQAYNALSIARAFASRLPSLKTFALRNDITMFSCSIDRVDGTTLHFYNVESKYPGYRFEGWNPRRGRTWGDEY